ncbi:MAG: M48 family metallopeptidase [Candidatus Pacearchaeota archaeon]
MIKQDFRISFYDQIKRNKISSFFLLIIIFGVLFSLIFVIGLAFGVDIFFILIIATIISLLYVWGSYYYSDKIAIASVGAKQADPNIHKQFYHTVEGLTLASGMPMPKLYVMEDPNINAFASGRDPKNSVICVTTGALNKLNKHELEGVLGHELAHIANYDIRFMTIATVVVGIIAIISQIFLRSLWFRDSRDNDRGSGAVFFLLIAIILAILAPIVVSLVQLAISRRREYVADASAVKFIRSPTGLIGALKKIQNENKPVRSGKVSKAIAPLFISDPFLKNFDNFFSTHPPLEKRIAILERM